MWNAVASVSVELAKKITKGSYFQFTLLQIDCVCTHCDKGFKEGSGTFCQHAYPA